MKVVQCSVCQREAAWVIEGEMFCEGHKENIIERFGINGVEIRRLTEICDGHATIPD